MSRWVVFAQALQDLLVVDEAVQRPQDEDIQGDVADLLQLKVPAQTLQPAGRPACLLQLQQNLRLLMQACCQGLWRKFMGDAHKWCNWIAVLQICKVVPPLSLGSSSAWRHQCADSLLLYEHWSVLPWNKHHKVCISNILWNKFRGLHGCFSDVPFELWCQG